MALNDDLAQAERGNCAATIDETDAGQGTRSACWRPRADASPASCTARALSLTRVRPGRFLSHHRAESGHGAGVQRAKTRAGYP